MALASAGCVKFFWMVIIYDTAAKCCRPYLCIEHDCTSAMQRNWYKPTTPRMYTVMCTRCNSHTSFIHVRTRYGRAHNSMHSANRGQYYMHSIVRSSLQPGRAIIRNEIVGKIHHVGHVCPRRGDSILWWTRTTWQLTHDQCTSH